MTTHIDPVCGMTVSENTSHKLSKQGETYYFCSSRCRDKFADQKSPLQTYFPLILIAFYLLCGVFIIEWRNGSLDPARLMTNFMGGFFLTFSFFKLLDLKGFASAFSSYDLVAKALPAYGFVYPFIELGLGIAYFMRFDIVVTNIATLVVMGVSTIGVVQSVARRSKIQCACLGTVINLPLSTVAIFENGLMLAMAAAALFGPGFHIP